MRCHIQGFTKKTNHQIGWDWGNSLPFLSSFLDRTSQEQNYGAVALRGVSGKSIDEHLAKRHNLPGIGTETWSFTYISAHRAVKDSNSGNYIKRTNRMKYMIFWVHEKNTQISSKSFPTWICFKMPIETVTKIFSQMVVWLVVSTHLKNISQNGNIKNIWNHHLVV